MIIFKTIRWKNFLSTGNIFTEVELNKESNALIVGENGAGKSTILDAITFALFGKPYRNINKPQIVNSVNGKDCLVELDFTIGDKSYSIRRGIKPGLFEVSIDGNLIDQSSSAKDYQDMLEKTILKMNYKSFTQIVILGSASFTPFMQLSPHDRRQVIEDLLDIQIFSNMNQIVKEKVSTLKNSVNELRIKIESIKEKIELHKSHIESLKKNNKELLDRKQSEFANNSLEITRLQEENVTLEDQISSLMKLIEELGALSKKQKILTSYQAKIEANKSKVEKEIEFFSNNENCPTCRQIIEETIKEETIHECTSKLNEYDDGLVKLKEEQDKVFEQLKKIEEIQKQVSKLQSSMLTNSTSIIHVQKYIRAISNEIDELNDKLVSNKDHKDQSKKLLEELTHCVEKRREATDEKQYYDIAAQLLKDGGIKSRIIKQYLPIINKLVNKYLAAMDFFVNFNIDEEFKETIKSRNRDDFSYENFSEGEKTRINLALLFTWRNIARIKNSVNTNLLILDEIFDSSLDSVGIDCLMTVLGGLDKINIFIISHKGDSLQDKFQHVIRFEKKGNFSQKRIVS